MTELHQVWLRMTDMQELRMPIDGLVFPNRGPFDRRRDDVLPRLPFFGAQQMPSLDQDERGRNEAMHRIQIRAAMAVEILCPIMAAVSFRPLELLPKP